MNPEVKRYADSRDLKSLKYIFVDSLDVDPTFVRYEEEYNYCSSCGVLESHIELTPFVYQESGWSADYWSTLKKDLLKNFSEKRMMHMREVAKVIFAEKIDRINEERQQRERQAKKLDESKHQLENKASAQRTLDEGLQKEKQQSLDTGNGISKKERQAKELEEEKRKLAAANEAEALRIEAEQKTEDDRARRQLGQQGNTNNTEKTLPKKAMGIVAAAIAVALIILIWLLH